jgi:hypothetical protein
MYNINFRSNQQWYRAKYNLPLAPSNPRPPPPLGLLFSSRGHDLQSPPQNVAPQGAWTNSVPQTMHQSSSTSDVARIMGWNYGNHARVGHGTGYGQQMSQFDVHAQPHGGRARSTAVGQVYPYGASSVVQRALHMYDGRAASDQGSGYSSGYSYPVIAIRS